MDVACRGPEDRPDASGTTANHPWARVLVPIALETVIAALDAVVFASASLGGLLIAGPFLSSALLRSVTTAAVGAYAVALAVAGALADGGWDGGAHVLRVLMVAGASVLAVWVARERERRLATLRDVERVAEAAQQAILRPVPPVVDDLAVATRYHSASTEATMGGDFYDVVSTPFGVRALIGDARGKGVAAIRLAGIALASFREAAYAEGDVTAVASVMDKSVIRESNGSEDFATALLAEFREDSVGFVSCGHHPALRVTRSGVEELRPADVGVPLGLGARPAVQVFPLGSGDRLLFYTDGAVEARAPDGRFFDLLTACSLPFMARNSLENALDQLLVLLAQHAVSQIDDDIALVLAERELG